jgi:polyhydroxybutyrate depolymerase
MKYIPLILIFFLFQNCFFLLRTALADKEIKDITIYNSTRKYILHLPKDYDPRKEVPLVIVLHGGGGNGRNVEDVSHFSEKSDKEGFIVVYPYGSHRWLGEKLLTWNSGNCCGYALGKNTNDVEYIKQLILFIKNQYLIQENKVFVTGMSNGGMMSYKLGCELSDHISGIAPVAGAMNLPHCQPKKPLSVFIIHGKKDKHVLYTGGTPKVQIDSHPRVDTSVANAEQFWKNQNECSDKKVEKKGKVEKTIYSCKKGNLAIVLLEDEGHTWPGGKNGYFFADEPSKEFLATDAMYEFWMQ